MSTNSKFIAASIGKFILEQKPHLLSQWCLDHGVNSIPYEQRNFYLMVLSKGETPAEEILKNNSADFGEIGFKLEDSIITEVTTNTKICDLSLPNVDKVIESELFISGRACGLEVVEINLDETFQQKLLNNPKAFTKNELDMNCLMDIPREEKDLNRCNTGWFYTRLSTNIMNDTPSQNGLLLNSDRAFKIKTSGAKYTPDSFAQSLAIDFFHAE